MKEKQPMKSVDMLEPKQDEADKVKEMKDVI